MPPRAPPAPGPRPPPRAAAATAEDADAGGAGGPGLRSLAPRPWRWLLLLALPAACSAPPPPRPVYTNHWAVQVLGGPAEADRVAAEHGYLNLGQVSAAGPERPKLSRPPVGTARGGASFRLAAARGQGSRTARPARSGGVRGALRGVAGGRGARDARRGPPGGPRGLGETPAQAWRARRGSFEGRAARRGHLPGAAGEGAGLGRRALPAGAVLSAHQALLGLGAPAPLRPARGSRRAARGSGP